MTGAYARLVEDPDPAGSQQATTNWCTGEDTLLAHELQGRPPAFNGRPSADRIALARLCAHYFSHGLFLEDGALLRDAGRLAGIPGLLVQGRLDLNGPLEAVWELSRAWPDAQLLVAEDAGHLGSETTGRYFYEAMDRFARR